MTGFGKAHLFWEPVKWFQCWRRVVSHHALRQTPAMSVIVCTFCTPVSFQQCPCTSRWAAGSWRWGRSSQRTVPSSGSGTEPPGLSPAEAPGSCWAPSCSLPCDRPGTPGRSPLCFLWPWASGNCRRGLCRAPRRRRSPTPRRRTRPAAGWAGGRSAPCPWRPSCTSARPGGGCSCWTWPRGAAWWLWWAVGGSVQCKGAGADNGGFIWWGPVGWSALLHKRIIRCIQGTLARGMSSQSPYLCLIYTTCNSSRVIIMATGGVRVCTKVNLCPMISQEE